MMFLPIRRFVSCLGTSIRVPFLITFHFVVVWSQLRRCVIADRYRWYIIHVGYGSRCHGGTIWKALGWPYIVEGSEREREGSSLTQAYGRSVIFIIPISLYRICASSRPLNKRCILLSVHFRSDYARCGYREESDRRI